MPQLEWWDTTSLASIFDVAPYSTLVDTTPVHTHNFIGGMKGVKHSEETKEKMRRSSVGCSMPMFHKGGRIMKDGVVVEFECQSHIAKKLGISSGHLSEVMNGKRRSVKGWVKL